jgi:nitrate reductase NapE component
MYQKITKTRASTDVDSAMEQKPLEKRVSLKSQKSKVNIKSVFVIFFCLFCMVNVAFAEKIIGTYSLSYFNTQYDIEASEIKGEKFTVYIQVSAENTHTRAMISVQSADIEKFVQFLLQMKEKYVEWSDVAKANNVTDMPKYMDFKSPSTTICWKGSEWFFSFGHKLQPRFLILENGKMVASIYKQVTSSSNQYIDEKIYWVFSDEKEIDNLVAQLSVEKIITKLKEKQNANDLFK